MSIDCQQPWLALAHAKSSSTIHEFKLAWSRLGIPPSAFPALTLMVGQRSKSLILQELCSRDEYINPDPHGRALLRKDRLSSDDFIYVDYELHAYRPPAARDPKADDTCITHEAVWLHDLSGSFTRRRVGNLLSGRAIGPLCHSICYFASDLGGIHGVATLIASLITEQPSTDLPGNSLPRAVVVVETGPRSHDLDSTELSLIRAITELIYPDGDLKKGIHLVQNHFRNHFSDLVMVGHRRQSGFRERARDIRRRLRVLKDKWACARMANNRLFRYDHTVAFSGHLLNHFCKDYRPQFSFILSSRPAGLDLHDFSYHLREIISLIPSEIWIWHLICPLLASSVAFSNFPPGSHKFSIAEVYEKLYHPGCNAVLSESVVQQETRNGFYRTLKKKLLWLEEQLVVRDFADIVSLHKCHLMSLQHYFIHIITHKTCLCCILRAPEKKLACGHGLCDICIGTLGEQSLEEKYLFAIETCPFCGKPNSLQPFRLMPPTAGVRLLSIDGGGSRAIVPLVFLRFLQNALVKFEVPLAEIFDFVCGTSSGGIVAIGLFLMRWSPEECISKFETLARKTFPSQNDKIITFGKLVLLYLRDGRYSSQPIEEAFRNELGKDIKMFNPLSGDTRVAVTTTTVKASKPCLITNYNGNVRDGDKGYEIVRASKSNQYASLSEAASCTSAAPWFFKPKAIEYLGTFQDGGLQHNNPLKIALWEIGFLWPQKDSPDFALSIGTGYSETLLPSRTVGPCSPVHEGFLARLFKIFMKSLDGEKMWRDFHNSLPENQRHRFHRLNVKLEGREPATDDTAAIPALKQQVMDYICSQMPLVRIIDSIIASSFYFEFEDCPEYHDDMWNCNGNIFCRLPAPLRARKQLYTELLRTSSYFLIFGRPVPCVERKMKSAPPFKCRVTFSLRNLDENVRITIRGITSAPMTISGLPRPAKELLEMQRIEAPFGAVNHNRSPKPLPRIPAKRKYRID